MKRRPQTLSQKINGMILLIFFAASSVWAGQQAATDKDSETSSGKNAQLSSTFHSVKPSTTQKGYKIANDGRNENSQVAEYQNAVSFEVFEDKDRDGRFGEKETQLQDLDQDTRKGEQEAQLGVESVTQNQRVTVLNNMGSGSLSSFKAAGQTRRSSIFAEGKKHKREENEEEEQEESEKEPESTPLPTPVASATPKSRVLVS